MKKLVYIFFAVLLFTSCSSESDTNLIDEISYSKNDNFSFQQVKEKEFSVLKSPRISYKNGSYWFKVVLTNSAEKENNLVFFLKEPSIKSIVVYNSEKIINSEISKKGATNISLKIKNEGQKVFFMNVDFRRQVHFPLEIYTTDKFYELQQRRNLGYGIYYGLAFMVFILNFIFYISLKDTTFLFYCAFLAGINFAFTGFDGTLHLFLQPEYFNIFIIITHLLVPLFGALFASKLLGLKQFFPKRNKAGYFALIFPAILYLLFFVTNKYIYCAIADLLSMLILAYYWFLGILMIKKEEYAKFFVIGYSIILFFGLFYLVSLNFGLSTASVTFNQLKAGALFEMMVLTYAITYRVKKMHQENEVFRDELKEYLEEIYGLEKQLKFQKNNKNKSAIDTKINDLKIKFNLTSREMDILLKITEGYSNLQIAEQLFISINTVKYHTKNLYEKLDIRKRSQLSSKFLLTKTC